MFGEVDRSATDLATHRQPLQHAHSHQHRRRPNAGLRVSRQQANAESRRTHQANGEDKDGSAAMAITE